MCQSCIGWNTKNKIENIYSRILTNTNLLYNFLCTTLYSINNVLVMYWFYFPYKIIGVENEKKKKKLHSKVWLIEYKVVSKKWYRWFVFCTYTAIPITNRGYSH